MYILHPKYRPNYIRYLRRQIIQPMPSNIHPCNIREAFIPKFNPALSLKSAISARRGTTVIQPCAGLYLHLQTPFSGIRMANLMGHCQYSHRS